ncbi:hypothetical protein PTTG_00920, partial [Puccinia triticina 1-1 BBBD Race 1]
MPPKSDKSDQVSRASSTRSAKPALVPAGEFKRGASKMPTPSLAAGGGVSDADSRSLQTAIPPSSGGRESPRDGSPTETGHGVPPELGSVDRTRSASAFDGGLESIFDTTGSTASERATTSNPPVPQTSGPPPEQPGSRERSSSEKPSRPASRSQEDGRQTATLSSSLLRTVLYVQNHPGGVPAPGRDLQSSSSREL